MIRRLWRTLREEPWELIRRRMIRETTEFIETALQHPELAVRIPMIRAGSGKFPPSMSEAFWEPILQDDP
jgi:hypothetical protein